MMMRILPLYLLFQHHTLITSETPLHDGLTSVWGCLCPYLMFLCDVPPCPTSCSSLTTWITCFHFSLATYPGSRLMEGAWWITFKWFLNIPVLFWLFTSHLWSSTPHQSYRHDIRFWYPVSVSLTVPSWHDLPRRRPQRCLSWPSWRVLPRW